MGKKVIFVVFLLLINILLVFPYADAAILPPQTDQGFGDRCGKWLLTGNWNYGECAECLFCDYSLGQDDWGLCIPDIDQEGMPCANDPYRCLNPEQSCAGDWKICVFEEQYAAQNYCVWEKIPDDCLEEWNPRAEDECKNKCLGAYCGNKVPPKWQPAQTYPGESMCFEQKKYCEPIEGEGTGAVCIAGDPPVLDFAKDVNQGEICRKQCDEQTGTENPCDRYNPTVKTKVQHKAYVCSETGCDQVSEQDTEDCLAGSAYQIYDCVMCTDYGGCADASSSKRIPFSCYCYDYKWTEGVSRCAGAETTCGNYGNVIYPLPGIDLTNWQLTSNACFNDLGCGQKIDGGPDPWWPDGICGNGITEPLSGEECDDGNNVDGDGCSSTCQLEVCGDGDIDGPEECDDGNNIDGDGCSSVCTIERCGDGHISPGENCDGLNWGPINGCEDFDSYTGGILTCDPVTCLFDTSLCTGGISSGFCGDGIINNGDEECDNNDWGPVIGCQNFDSWTGGTLSCDSQCNFDTSDCNSLNSCPMMYSVTVTDPAYTDSAITAISHGWTDFDFHQEPQYKYKWYKNDVLVSETIEGPSSVYPGTKIRGDEITVVARPYDGECFGNEVEDSVTISNRPPYVSLTVAPPTITGCFGTATLSANAFDPDGDTVIYNFDFESDGIFDTGWISNAVTTHLYTSYGQPSLSYFVTVKVSDSHDITVDIAKLTVVCNPSDLPCQQVENLTAELDNDLKKINLSWDIPVPNNITNFQICQIDEITPGTDLSSATGDFNCNYLGSGTVLSSSSKSWQDTNAEQKPKSYYKVRSICSYPGINQTKTTGKTVGKYEIPLFVPSMPGDNPVGLILDKFTVPLMPHDTNIFKALKSLGSGRGKSNALLYSSYPTVCNQPDFSGNYSDAWEWDAFAYLNAGKNEAAGLKYYNSRALCPLYLSATYDLKNIQPGRYYEIEMDENDVLVNVGEVLTSYSVDLYSGIEVERKSPLGITLPYQLPVGEALSDIGSGRGYNNGNPDYSEFESCTGDSADDFSGDYSFVSTYDGPDSVQTYDPNQECPFYDFLNPDIRIINIIPGEAYLVTMTDNGTADFEH